MAIALALAGCAAGPDYVRVPVDVPPAYKEGSAADAWKIAEPKPVDAKRRWWELYEDPTLNQLIEQADSANQDIALAEAQYRQATAVLAEARSTLYPDIGANAGASRGRTNNRNNQGGRNAQLATDLNLGVSATWEPDLWGNVRRAVEAGNAGVQASADDLAAAHLSIQATVARDYLQLRALDVERDLYAATIEAYARSLKLTQSQYTAGTALRSDVALAQSQLKTAQADGVDLEATRAQLEHAIAILLGKAPASFSLAPVKTTIEELQSHLPAMPVGLPSALLEHRPDIAASERRVALANANIGVAQAAFYPTLTLDASGGFASNTIGSLIQMPSRVWSLGATLAQTLFDGGLRRARSDEAIAIYDQSVATYKSTVLTAFQQVEDNLASLRVLDQEKRYLDDAVQGSQLAERSALSQYRAGTLNFLSVVTAQTLSLNNQRSVTQVVSRQLVASVNLITATGGGWSVQ